MPRPSPARDRIVRFLLIRAIDPERIPHPSLATITKAAQEAESLYALAKSTRVSFPWVHEVVTDLKNRGWIGSKDPLHVTNVAALYDWWKHHKTPVQTHNFYAADPASLIRDLLEQDLPYAVTTYHAENFWQSHLFPRRIDAYVRTGDLTAIKSYLVSHGAQIGGTNLRLWTGDDQVVEERFSAKPINDQLLLAPLPQVIVDLLREGGSAGEAGELLIQRGYPHAHAPLQ